MPIDDDNRSYEVFLRGPIPHNRFAFGTVEDYREGIWHKGTIANVPEPSDNPLNDFGIQEGGGFVVELADEDASDWPIDDEAGDPILDELGSPIIEEY